MKPRVPQHIWASKYRYTGDDGGERDIGQTWSRVTAAVAGVERDPNHWQARFLEPLSTYRFLPGGRVLAGAGTGRQVTLFNCFVSGTLVDSVEGILDSLKETAITMQQGGGIGIDFSPLRPAGTQAVRSGSIASGPLSFMHIWNLLCRTLLATSTRRGAMMGTLRCDHPDIVSFIDAKRNEGALENFNLSILVTDDLLQAVDDDREWPLVYPAVTGEPVARVPARRLWQRIVSAAHETAEPGLLFVDTINRNNNLFYCEQISATNPCGEVPLPPYGACDLGSVNLTSFVSNPFSRRSAFNHELLGRTVTVAVRFLDNVIDVSRFPLRKQAQQARSTRRIGLGITGLADALTMLGYHYDSDPAREFAGNVMRRIRDAAYSTSIALAEEKSAFELFDKDRYLSAPFIERLPGALRDAIAFHGIRNSHLLAVAPAGTISLLAGNVSSGIEPIYALQAERAVRSDDLSTERLQMNDFAYDLWRRSHRGNAALPRAFVTAGELPASSHLEMQACLQPYVDGAISKTINLSPDATTDDVARAFRYAHRAGIKGCTVYRPGARQGQVLRTLAGSHCCNTEREAD